MNLEKYISNLLYSHECVIVPEFGGFITNYEAASIQSTTHAILPPRHYLVFNSSLTINDGLLATEISIHLKCGFEEAMRLIRLEVTAWHERLKAGKTVVMPGIGAFSLNREGKIEFKPEPDQNFFGETFGMSALVIPALPKRRIKQKEEFRNRKVVAKHSGRKLRRTAMAAAITVPLLAAGIWSFLNFDTLKYYAVQHSGIAAVLRLGNVQISENATDTCIGEILHPQVSESPETNLTAKPPDVLLEKHQDEASVAEISAELALATEPVTPVTTQPLNTGSKAYHIIVGSFESMGNASHLADQLAATGWDTKVIDSDNGMHRVSIISFISKEEALQKLVSIRQESSPGAWLLRL